MAEDTDSRWGKHFAVFVVFGLTVFYLFFSKNGDSPKRKSPPGDSSLEDKQMSMDNDGESELTDENGKDDKSEKKGEQVSCYW